MRSLKSLAGYMLVDNSNSPGVPQDVLDRAGLPVTVGRARYETEVYQCSHCECALIPNPQRTRERYVCFRCNHYICDECKAKQVMAGGACLPYKAMIEEMWNEAQRTPASTESFIIKP